MNILFCTAPHGPAERTGYDHSVVALAEGLELLNESGAQHRWSGTVPYWKQSDGRWLVPCDGVVTWENADLIIVSYLLIGDGIGLPPELRQIRKEVKTVFLDSMDGWRGFFLRPEMRRFDLVLRTHLSHRYPVPDNVRPWAFGLTQRILKATEDGLPWVSRRREVLYNFRVGHPLRDWARRVVVPGLSSQFICNGETDATPEPSSDSYQDWAQTGRRHYPSYYSRLTRAAIGATYGGYFAPGVGLSLNAPLLRLLYKAFQWSRWKSRTVVQFDSWRLWETMAAGALTVHVNFDRYGAYFPVQPVDRQHYWSISPNTAARDISELLEASPATLGAIADQGKSWAREQYGPQAQIRRLFAYLNFQEC